MWPQATCALGRCLSIDAAAAKKATGPVYPDTAHCPSTSTAAEPSAATACAQLATSEWLANAGYWTTHSGGGGDIIITATEDTYLKKSTADSGCLPDDQVKKVRAGQACKLVNQTQFAGYWLCALEKW
jgi:hypothetical protein